MIISKNEHNTLHQYSQDFFKVNCRTTFVAITATALVVGSLGILWCSGLYSLLQGVNVLYHVAYPWGMLLAPGLILSVPLFVSSYFGSRKVYTAREQWMGYMATLLTSYNVDTMAADPQDNFIETVILKKYWPTDVQTTILDDLKKRLPKQKSLGEAFDRIKQFVYTGKKKLDKSD